MSEPLLSIVIANYNNPHLIAKCIETINVHMRDIRMEVIIVDNNSKVHNLHKICELYDYVRVIYLAKNMGFGYANNVGVRNSRGKVLLLLNSDTELFDSSLSDVIRNVVSVDAKVIWGVRLIWPDGRFQNSYSKEIRFLDFIGDYTPLCVARHYFRFISGHKYHNVEFDGVTEVGVVFATAMVIRKVDFEKLRGFSGKYYMYFEDIDLCDRFRQDHSGKVLFNPKATIIHNRMGSSNESELNLEFLKSKYKYGYKKFGSLRVVLFIGLDLLLLIAVFIKRCLLLVKDMKECKQMNDESGTV